MQKVKPDILSYIVSCSLPHQLFQKCFFCRQKLAGLGAEIRHPQGSAWALIKDSKKRRFAHLFPPLLSSLKSPQPFWNQDWFHGRQLFHGSGLEGEWFRDDSSTVHLLCTLLVLGTFAIMDLFLKKRKKNIYIYIYKSCFGDFSGGLVAKIPHPQCREPGFHPWSPGTRSHMPQLRVCMM